MLSMHSAGSTRLLISLLVATAVSGHIAAAYAESFTEGRYEVIDTGLEQSTLYGPGVLGEWLDNHRIIVNALEDSLEARKNWQLRLMIFDVRTRKAHEVAKSVHLNCRDSDTEIASIVEDQNNVSRFSDRKQRFVRMDAEGRMSPLKETPQLDWFCRKNTPRFIDHLQAFLRSGDGYIDYGKTGGGHSTDPAILYRPDGIAVELPVLGGDISGPLYVRHLNRYLLGQSDYLSGYISPAGKPVFNLMAPDGNVLEIPQPVDFVKNVAGFGEVRFVRDGIVLENTGPKKKNAGLYFLKDKLIVRVFGADEQIATRLLVSPDGCRLAFLGFKNYDFTTKKTVKIINLCEGK